MKKYEKIIASLLALSLASGSVLSSSESIRAIYYPSYIGDYGRRGDTNKDDKLTLADIQRFHDRLLCVDEDESGWSRSDDYIYDVNSDGQINVLDMMRLKSAVFENKKIWSYKDLPVMDGSTSAIPLEAGLKSRLLGIPYFNTRESVNHHKTHESFQMLLSGDIDMIFTVPISESQQKAADEAGVHLNMVPVAKEGFVFVVNKNNPVDSLTQQQIKDIYSGKITNWSEVGGNDEPIIPYQRNKDSGSQNYMIEFMKDSELCDPPTSYEIASMGVLLDAVAVYENSSQAIGYSVYSYAAQMYENSPSVKFIAVDGVRPSRETMADDTYPLLSNTYIMYPDDPSKNTLEFTEWAVSEEGQQCVLENGYIPVKTMEYPSWMKLYNLVGSGKERPEDLKPDINSSTYFRSYSLESGETIRLNCLKDKKLEDEINRDITEALNSIPNADHVRVSALNGYMSVEITSKKTEYEIPYEFSSVYSYSDVVTLNYDLITGRKIENLSDYFYKGIDFAEYINKCIAEELNDDLKFLTKTDFLGIAGDIDKFTYNSVYSGNNSYFVADNIEFSFDSYYLPDIMITGEYYDMRDLFEDPEDVHEKIQDEWNYEYVGIGDNNFIKVLEGSRFHSEEEIAQKKKIYDRMFESLKNIITESGERVSTYLIAEPNTYDYMKKLNVYIAYKYALLLDWFEIKTFMFDPETGEHVKPSDIFGESAKKYDDKNVKIRYVTFENRTVSADFWISSGNYGDVEVETLTFDIDDVNMKYINRS